MGAHYTRTDLIRLAAQADAGFDPKYFAEMLARIERFDDEDFLRYEITPEQLSAVRAELAGWHHELTQPDRRPPTRMLGSIAPEEPYSGRQPPTMSGPSL